MPGLVSTLLNQAYSMPSRLVHTFLQVTEQVWQPMHLSRFSTMRDLRADLHAAASFCVRVRLAGLSSQSTLFILRTITNSSRLEPTVP